MGKRLPGLDGVRAVAVGLVVLGHAAIFLPLPDAIGVTLPSHVARLGVTIFFVLSGFLITLLMLEERARTGRISLGGFYARRTIRIFPAAYLYIAVVALAAWVGWITLVPGDLLHAVTYTMNYNHERSWAIGHLRSLAVEEQFYLLWPLLLLWSGKWSLALVVSLVVLMPVVRVAAWVLLPSERLGIDEEFQYVADALVTGCLLALLVDRFGLERVSNAVPGWVFALAPIVALAATLFSAWPSFYLPVGATLTHVGIALSILWLVWQPGTRIGRVMNSSPAVFLGAISYSLYLWQQLFLAPELYATQHALALALLASFAAALASYHLVEKPLLRWRARFRH